MHASLPMYDLPALREATDEWWAGIAHHLRAAGVAGVPARLSRRPAPDCGHADLLFGQTCGYPLVRGMCGEARLLCTPCYTAPGCAGPRYASVLIVQAGSAARVLADLRGGRCVINNRASHSGCNVLRRMCAPLADGAAFFARVTESGSHAASIAAVADGEADLCAVDAVTHALLSRHEPERLEGTRSLGFSPGAPSLPCIAGPAVDPATAARMRAALHGAAEDSDLADARDLLLIDGVADLPLSAYEEIATMETEAEEMGYPVLR